MSAPVGLFFLGAVLGVLGTLIGAGGGFLLVPVLLLLYPDQPPETITSISLAVVFFNAFSGTVAYGRMKRIDYRSGLWFLAAGIPGSVLGAWATNYVPRRTFDGVFGVILVGMAILLFVIGKPRPSAGAGVPGHTHRIIVEADGTRHEYRFRLWVGVVLSIAVGFASSLLGIGGGIIHVPALVYLLSFPVHIATATSHFILAGMTLTATLVHLYAGNFGSMGPQTAALGVGALLGAQLGARLSGRVRSEWIIRTLAVGVAFVGARVILLALGGS